METLEIILLMLGCVMLSSIFNEVLPRVSLPLVQIAIGIIVGFFFVDDPASVLSDPELFLPLFIAPLLFDESRHLDKEALWNNLGAILLLAIGLVLITMLVAGYAFHLLVPSIPLAAAFALGAALSPTDAVAVSALGSEVDLTKRQEARLSGEALFNDATGIITFEFAIAAAVTGTFSLAEATGAFLLEFFGGIIVGLLLAAVIMFVLSRVVMMGIESPTVYVLIEVGTPFFAYFLGELVGVSGMLAVVSSGLFMRFYPSKLTVESSRYAVASENVWELISYVINGLVFVLLGMELPSVIMPTWNATGSAAAGWWLVGVVLVMLVVVEAVRFLWIFLTDWWSNRYSVTKAHRALAKGKEPANVAVPERKSVATIARETLTTTFSGAKGAITMTVVLSIPYTVDSGAAFPERDLLIFVASCVIIGSFILANFLVPVLSPSEEDEERVADRTATEVEILQNVIIGLKAQMTPENEAATLTTVDSYRSRIDLTRADDGSDEHVRELRLDVLNEQLDYVRDKVDAGEVSRPVGEHYASTLNTRIRSMEKARRRGLSPYQRHVGADAKRQMRTPLSWIWSSVKHWLRGRSVDDDERAELGELIYDTECHAVEYMEQLSENASEDDQRILSVLRIEHIPTMKTAYNAVQAAEEPVPMEEAEPNLGMGNVGDALAAANRAKEISRAVEAEALSMELEQIQMMRDDGRLSSADARELRSEVYVLQMGLEAR